MIEVCVFDCRLPSPTFTLRGPSTEHTGSSFELPLSQIQDYTLAIDTPTFSRTISLVAMQDEWILSPQKVAGTPFILGLRSKETDCSKALQRSEASRAKLMQEMQNNLSKVANNITSLLSEPPAKQVADKYSALSHEFKETLERFKAKEDSLLAKVQETQAHAQELEKVVKSLEHQVEQLKSDCEHYKKLLEIERGSCYVKRIEQEVHQVQEQQKTLQGVQRVLDEEHQNDYRQTGSVFELEDSFRFSFGGCRDEDLLATLANEYIEKHPVKAHVKKLRTGLYQLGKYQVELKLIDQVLHVAYGDTLCRFDKFFDARFSSKKQLNRSYESQSKSPHAKHPRPKRNRSRKLQPVLFKSSRSSSCVPSLQLADPTN